MNEHNHSSHILLLLLLLVPLGILLLKNYASAFSFKKWLIFLSIVSLLITHASPGKLLFAYHHQTETHTSHSPCCMPVTSFVIVLTFLSSLLFVVFIVLIRKNHRIPGVLFSLSFPRSPPYVS